MALAIWKGLVQVLANYLSLLLPATGLCINSPKRTFQQGLVKMKEKRSDHQYSAN